VEGRKSNVTPEGIVGKTKKENAVCVATLGLRNICSDARDATTDFSTYIAAGCTPINWN